MTQPVQPYNPLRAALERFGHERRGQPQPHEFFTTEERKAMEFPPEQGQPHEFASMPGGYGLVCRVCNKHRHDHEQGQPQQEPAREDWIRAINEAAPGRFTNIEPQGPSPEPGESAASAFGLPYNTPVYPAQERQAGVHVHVVLQGHNYWDGTYFYCDNCDKTWDDVQQVYEQGLADAAAQTKER